METTKVKIKEVVIEQPDNVKMYLPTYAYFNKYDNKKYYRSGQISYSFGDAEFSMGLIKKYEPSELYSDFKIITFNLPNLNK